MSELKPCPFCGSARAVHVDDYYIDPEETVSLGLVVVCDASSANRLGGCGASSGCQDTEAEAIAAWNQRAGENNGNE